MGTGAVVRPEHWDGQQVKVQHGKPHAAVNPRLNRAAEAQQLATKQGRKLPAAELKQALAAVLTLAPVAALPPLPPAESQAFDSLQTRWISEHSQRPRPSTGQPLSKLAVAGLMATQARLAQYARARGVVLSPERLDLTFYQDFRTYVIDELGQSVNTFGKHIDRLKTLLT